MFMFLDNMIVIMLVQIPPRNAPRDVITQQKRHRQLCDVMNAIISNQCALTEVTMPAQGHNQFRYILCGNYNNTLEN